MFNGEPVQFKLTPPHPPSEFSPDTLTGESLR
jgi:hypothetical protein